MSLTTEIKPMKLITAVCGAIGTSLGLAVGVATTPTALQNTTISSNFSKDTVKWSE